MILLWIADNGTGLLTNYKENGVKLNSIIVDAVSGTNAPTGLVRNKCDNFTFTNGTVTAPAKLIVVTENGTINAYNQNVSATDALIVISSPGKVFKGAEIDNKYLYVCNFNSGYVEQYDGNFNFVKQFTDTDLLNIGYAPFNIKKHCGKFYMTFAKQDEAAHDDVAGLGNGFVDIFSDDGIFIKRLINRGPLNSPWGLEFIDDIMYIGNFGDGIINEFCVKTGEFIGPLKDEFDNIITIDGLWSVLFE